MTDPKSEVVNVRISSEELAAVDALAERSRVSRSAVVRVLILEGLERNDGFARRVSKKRRIRKVLKR